MKYINILIILMLAISLTSCTGMSELLATNIPMGEILAILSTCVLGYALGKISRGIFRTNQENPL